MIAVLFAVACLPTVNWPAPVLSWDQADVARTDGHRVEMCDPEACAWRTVADLPCLDECDEAGQVVARRCRGDQDEPGFPLHRGTDAEAVVMRFRVVAYNAAGDSAPSEAVEFCLPRIWQPGETYE